MNIAFYNKGCLICIIKEVKDIIKHTNGIFEIWVEGKSEPIIKKERDYGEIEIWK